MAWAYLPSPPNLLDLAIKNENNYKTRSFGYERRRKRKVSLPALLAIASPLPVMLKHLIKTQ
tara:strand:- start:103 stop:288 length:186 start_codon:yes stop_codon:yes gene_type:complete